MACVIARMWASVNEPRNDEPRCPLVPKLTAAPGPPARAVDRSTPARAGQVDQHRLAARASRQRRQRGGFYDHWTWSRLPDVGRVLGNRAVAGEFAGARHVQDGLAGPCIGVGVQRAEPVGRPRGTRADRPGACRSRRRVSSTSRRGANDARLVPAEVIGEDEVQRCSGLGLVVVVPARAVPAAAGGDLFRGQAEEEEVLLARFLGHLDGRAVAGADGQRAVHHELHVAGAAGLIARGGDLVGDVGGGDQALGQRDAVVGQEHDFEPPAHGGVARRSSPARLLMNLMMSLAS